MSDHIPYDSEAEQSTLGCALKSAKALDEIVDILPSEKAFYDRWHQLIFKTILELHRENCEVDIVTVSARLGTEGLKRTGGRTYLVELTESVSATNIAPTHAKIVKNKADLRGIIQASQASIEAAQQPGASPQDVADGLERALLASNAADASKVHDAADAAPDYAAVLLGGKEVEDRGRVIETRIPELNEELGGGLRPGHLVVIGGSPSMGKTSFAMDTVLYNGNYGRRSLIFTIDETVDDVLLRAYQLNLGLDPHRMYKHGPWTDEEKARIEMARDSLSDQPWSVIGASGMTAMTIRSRARAYTRAHGRLDILVVDYMGQVRPAVGRGNQSREREMAEIALALKEIANELGCCVLAISQLNRSLSNEQLANVNNRSKRRIPKPHMSMLRDSGEIEASANVVLLPFLPSEYLRERLGAEHEWTREVRGNEPNIMPAEIIVAKNKLGPKCWVPCHFHTARMRFFSLAKQPEPALELEEAPF